MTTKNIQEAKDPDLRASVAAIARASQLARQTAIQTGTNLVIMVDGKLVHISPQQLQEAIKNAPKTNR